MEMHANNQIEGGASSQVAEAAEISLVKQTTVVGELPRDSTDKNEIVEKVITANNDKTTAINNNNGNNKLKQTQQQQHHQFRTPQQFIKHKKTTNSNNSSGGGGSYVSVTLTNNNNKKGKTWNKRQHKNNAKQFQQQQQNNQLQQQQLPTSQSETSIGQNNVTNNNNNNNNNNSGNICNLLAGQTTAGSLASSTKADLENSQNLKNQLTAANINNNNNNSGSSSNNNTNNNNNNNNNHHNNNSNNNHSGHHYHYHHHKNHYGIVGGSGNGNGSGVASNINSEGRSVGNGLVSTPNLTNTTEKLTYGHGHIKQLHKKILAHRGHHHHVLCAAHNNNANVNGGVGSGGTNCCLATNQSAKEVKDPTLITNLLTKCATNVRHFCCARAKFFLPEKRPRKEIIIPPTKFLLGGNISDPLNLNSLQNEASSNNNTPATTPRRSPITTPPKVEVIIPPNIHDPLHLLDPVDSMEYEKQLTSPMKRGSVGGLRGGLLHNMLPHFNKHRQRKHRKPKRRRHESHNSSIVSTANTVSVSDETCSLNNSNTSTKLENVSNRQQLGDASTTADYSMEERKENITDVLSGEVEHVERHKATLVLSPHNNETDIVTAAIKITTTIVATRSLNSSRDEQSTQSMQQQHVAGDMLPVVEQRVNRSDLRLDLTSTTNSTASSTCGSLNNSRNGCRKRKISESNNSQKNKKFFRMDSMDKIVSPVVPQPGARKRVTLLATGARKPNKRSMSVSESEILSPAEELVKPLLEESLRHSETPVEKLDNDLVIPGSPSSGASVENDSAVVVSDMKVPTTEAEKISTDVPNATSQAVLLANPASLVKLPKFPADGPKYRYGNYDRYSGFRNLNGFIDVRLQVFQRHVELFQGKDILDIGCNVGHMTITVARNLAPKSIKGIDIDLALVSQARRNLSLYVRIPSIKKSVTFKEEDRSETTAAVVNKMKGKKIRRKNRGGQNINKLQQQTSSNQQQQHLYNYGWPSVQQQHNRHRQRQQELRVPTNEFFPMSFPLTFGGIPASHALLTATNSITTTTTTTTTNISINNKKTTPTTNENTTTATSSTTTTIVHQKKTKNDFPRNVYFQQSNYVLKDEALLANDTQQYDLILCLSVTKWIHLNFGDAGLKLAFKRMFNQLRPGGKLILEAQNWASYKKKKNLTEEIYNNYKNIEFFPNKFHEYLLSSEVGFSHSYTLGVPRHMNKGFCRPIQLYAKGDYTPNHVRWSDAHYPQTPFEAYRGIYATMPPRPVGMAYPICSSRSQNYDTPHHTGASSGPYSCRQTPMHQPTSQYYNPLETDSYQPSYDMEYLNHMYVFASPLYQTVWSPPASLRKSSSHTPLFGSVRDAEFDGECSGGGNGSGGHYPRHVYPPNEDTSSPNANMGGAFNSIHEVDTDDSNQPPSGGVRHVYATTHCGESSSSPQVNHHDVECIVSDEDVATTTGKYCDLSEP